MSLWQLLPLSVFFNAYLSLLYYNHYVLFRHRWLSLSWQVSSCVSFFVYLLFVFVISSSKLSATILETEYQCIHMLLFHTHSNCLYFRIVESLFKFISTFTHFPCNMRISYGLIFIRYEIFEFIYSLKLMFQQTKHV